MDKKTLKFSIRQDGIVTEEVIGAVGNECQEITKSLEEKLGVVENRKYKTEHYLHQPIDNFWKNFTEEYVSLHNHKNQDKKQT